MVQINSSSANRLVRRERGGFFLSNSFLLALTIAGGLFVWESESLARVLKNKSDDAVIQSTPALRNPHDQEQCRWYLAESAVAPNSGLGLFAGVGVLPGETVGSPDICIFVSDAPDHWTHLRGHSYGWGTFFGQFEGVNSRAACEGFATIMNTMPPDYVNVKINSGVQPTHAGLTRFSQPGAGAITHHYGTHAEALSVIPAGAEFTHDYGDFEFPEANFSKPQREVEELRERGWCVDNVDIRQATDPSMGRGAFAKRRLSRGDIVAPAPLQVFKDRAVFAKTQPEQLYVNYCVQPENSDMLFFPYGPGAGLINHAKGTKANCRLEWSKSHLHHHGWLNLNYDDFWQVVKPGGLILEVVATRDILPGEELFMDYGSQWEAAWLKHKQNWRPVPRSEEYVYPQDMDETGVLRTVHEQKSEPYPNNLAMLCSTPDWDRENGNHIEWREPKVAEYAWGWAENFAYCFILNRTTADNGDIDYTVSLEFHEGRDKKLSRHYDASVPIKDQYIDRHVPRHAIRWVEKPYFDDEHIEGAFRHPIGFPDHLVPDAWRRTRENVAV